MVHILGTTGQPCLVVEPKNKYYLHHEFTSFGNYSQGTEYQIVCVENNIENVQL